MFVEEDFSETAYAYQSMMSPTQPTAMGSITGASKDKHMTMKQDPMDSSVLSTYSNLKPRPQTVAD